MASQIYDFKRQRSQSLSAKTPLSSSDRKIDERDISDLCDRVDTTAVARSAFSSFSPKMPQAPRVSFTPIDNGMLDKTALFPKIELLPRAKPLHSDEKQKRDLYIPKKFGFSLPADLVFNNLLEPINKDVIFYYSNEKNQSLTLTLLSIKSFWPAPLMGVHIGFSSIFNLDLICARRSKLAFFCDLSLSTFIYYFIIQETIKASKSRYEFVEKLIENLIKNNFLRKDGEKPLDKIYRNVFVTSKDLEEYNLEPHMSKRLTASELSSYFRRQLTHENSWLSTDENYEYIRNLYLENKIIHLPLDAKDRQGNFKILADWINLHGYKLDTLYLSNIHAWLNRNEHLKAFDENIDILMNDTAVVIDSISQKNDVGIKHLHQRCFHTVAPHYLKEAKDRALKEIKI